MAKLLLLGATLVGCLVLVHTGDPVCNVAIERTDLEDPDRVQLHCIVTGNATSLTWTRDGQPVPMTPSQPATLLVEIPSKYAKGYFECHVFCSKDLSQRASMSLDLFVKPDTGLAMAIVMAVSISMAVLFIGLVLLHISCYCGQRYQHRMRLGQGNSGDQGAGRHAMVLTARPLIAPPLAASQVA